MEAKQKIRIKEITVLNLGSPLCILLYQGLPYSVKRGSPMSTDFGDIIDALCMPVQISYIYFYIFVLVTVFVLGYIYKIWKALKVKGFVDKEAKGFLIKAAIFNMIGALLSFILNFYICIPYVEGLQ